MLDTQPVLENFPVNGILPKTETRALAFLSKYPEYDGKGVLIAILDTGVDPGAPGLQFTSDGRPKIVDLIDATGAGDVDISTIREVDNDGYIVGLSERKLKIPSTWSNPSKKFNCGLKAVFDLYTSGLRDRVRKERKDKLWSQHHDAALAQAQKRLTEFNSNEANKSDKNFEASLLKEELQSQIDVLKDLENKVKDCGPIYDCLVWTNDDGVYCACIDTTEKGNLEECKVLTNFKDSHEYGTFTDLDMLNYSVRIMPENNTLQIVTDSGSHGTHVASIATGFFEANSDLNGVAPGAQVLGIKIGDNRLNGMETSTALVNAFRHVIEYKCNLVNFSFGEPVSYCNKGPALSGFEELVEKYGVIVCASAGNNGPGLETIGAPAGYAKYLISVGAYVSGDMLKAEHSVLGTNARSMMFTWSSRGPTIDGYLGVSVCAPGGAFAAVPNWTLRGTQLMSGTSMSSPNCCGSIALILSGLLANNIEYYPYGVQRALENTALPVDETIGSGSGLIQIDKAFDYLTKYQTDTLNKIHFEVSCGPKSTRGIYLKHPDEVTQTRDYMINVEPKFFVEYADKNKFFKVQRDKIALNMRLALVCDDTWVECPKHLYVVNGVRSFFVRVHANDLEEDKFHFTQIRAYDVDNIEKGCVFKIPIAVIKPLVVNEKKYRNYEVTYKNVNFQQGQIYRHFIRVPYGATHAELNFKSNNQTEENRDHSPLVYIQTFTFDKYQSYDDTECDEIYRLNMLNNLQYLFKVQSNKVVQICICKNWSNIGNLIADYEIKFNGIFQNNVSTINCVSSEPRRIDLHCLQDTEDFEPTITWKTWIQTLRPTDNVIELYKAGYAEIKSIYQLVLTYTFNKGKSGEVCCEVPLLSNYLYENEFQSVFWMLFDASTKRLLCSGDAFPAHYKYGRTIEKGDYVVKLYVRHDKQDSLEKLKSLALYIRHSISNISQDVYPGYESLVKNVKKNSTGQKLYKGQHYTIFLDSLNDDKLPKGIAPGNFLKGEISFYKDSKISKVDNYEIVYEIHDYQVKKSDSNSNSSKSTTDDKEKDKKSEEDKLNEALRDLKVSWALKSNEVFDKLVEEYKDHVPLYLNRIKYLDQQIQQNNDNLTLKQTHWDQIIELCRTALSKINQNDLLSYLGVKKQETENDDLKKEMENQKGWIVDLLCYQGVAIIEKSGNDVQAKDFDELKSIYKGLQKWIDITDSKVSKFVLKFCMVNKFYARALKNLFKQLDDKISLATDRLVMEVLKQLELDYTIYFYENDLLLKYPKNYAKF